MSVMLVGAIVALIVVVMALGGSQIARRWAIGMYGLLAALLNPGRRSTYRCGDSVQTTGASSMGRNRNINPAE